MLPYILSISFCAIWAYALIYMRRATASLPMLREETGSISGETSALPSLSVIIPACNEADHLEPALTSLLGQDYPRLELIVIDDRSTDGTAAIIDRLARSDARIRAVHIESLPDGWLGKVHALHRGTHQTGGDWYLFTDADVHFQPGALRRAVYYAKQHGLNHLACLPEISGCPSFWLDVMIRSFFLLFAVTARLAEVNRESSKRAVGVGACNLVDAATFQRTPGFEWLRMDPADDLGVGALLKQAGARSRLLNADGEIRVQWYGSIGAMIRGLEKNTFGPGARYSYARQLIIVLLLWCLASIPLLSLAIGLLRSDAVLLAAGGAALATTLIVALAMPRKAARDVASYLAMPFGTLLMSFILLRSAYKCLRNGGIDWRGTHYSVKELRQGQRVRF